MMTNIERARWAQDALNSFNQAFHGQVLGPQGSNDLEDQIAELVISLLHLAQREGFDPEAVFDTIQDNYSDDFGGADA
jgi:hypothetical protein